MYNFSFEKSPCLTKIFESYVCEQKLVTDLSGSLLASLFEWYIGHVANSSSKYYFILVCIIFGQLKIEIFSVKFSCYTFYTKFLNNSPEVSHSSLIT